MWVKNQSPVIYGSLASFGMALMVTLYDGKSWPECLPVGVICLLISMGVINSLEYFFCRRIPRCWSALLLAGSASSAACRL